MAMILKKLLDFDKKKEYLKNKQEV